MKRINYLKNFPFISLLIHAGLLFSLMSLGVYFFRGDQYQQELEKFNKNIQSFERTFFQNEISGLLRGFAFIDDHVRNYFSPEKLNQGKDLLEKDINDHFEIFRKNFNIDIVYMMDIKGDVLISTAYEGNQTLKGNNYSFRPYFTEALKRETIVYPAVGVTTKQRGIYYSAPIIVNNETKGVLVFKFGLGKVDKLLHSIFSGQVFFVSPQGIVFSSNQDNSLYKNIFNFLKLDPSKTEAIVGNTQHYILKKEYDFPGNERWQIICLVPSLSKMQMGTLIIFVIIFIGLYIFLIHFIDMYRRNKNAEKAKKDGEETMRFILDKLPLPLYLTKINGEIIFINAQMKVLLNIKDEAVEDLRIRFSSGGSEKFFSHGEDFISLFNRKKVGQEKRDPIPVYRTRILVKTQNDDEVIELMVDLRDAQKREYELKIQHEFIHQVFESIGGGLLVVRVKDGEIKLANKEATNLKLKEGEIIEATLFDKIWRDVAKTKSHISQEAFGLNQKYYELQGDPIFFDRHEDVEEVVISIRDITKRKEEEKEKNEVQKQLFQTSKLASIGELAAGVAHEINNPLTVIKGFSDAIDDHLKKDSLKKETEDVFRFLDKIRMASDRIAKIVNGLRVYSRTDAIQDAFFNGHESIQNTIEMIKIVYEKSGVNINTEYQSKKNILFGVDGKFQQVVMNFLSNAKDAILEKSNNGIIKIRTYDRENEFIFEIEDSGVGMDEVTKNKIFETFFTTKPVGKGTGLGMGLSQSIILAMKGHVEVESVLGKGTTVRVIIPHKRGENLKKEETDKKSDSLISNIENKMIKARVMIVDDEKDIGIFLQRILSKFILQVNLLTSGNEALSELKKNRYDLLITDLNMPEVSGADLIRAIHQDLPYGQNLKIIVMTGGVDINNEGVVAEDIRSKISVVLEKPFDNNLVKSKVREILGDKIL